MVTPRAKRFYSYDFKSRSEKDIHISLRRVPPELHRSFKAKCKRENISMRFLILSWVRNWIADRRPDDDGEPHTPEQLKASLDALQRQMDTLTDVHKRMRGLTEAQP